MVPNAQRAAVVAGVELASYDWCKKKILDHDLMEDNIYAHFLWVYQQVELYIMLICKVTLAWHTWKTLEDKIPI